MPQIEFTSQLAQQVDCPVEQHVDAASLDQALQVMFEAHPGLRALVLDSDGAVHQHLAIFVDGEMLARRDQLAVPLKGESEVFVMQAVSGG